MQNVSDMATYRNLQILPKSWKSGVEFYKSPNAPTNNLSAKDEKDLKEFRL